MADQPLPETRRRRYHAFELCIVAAGAIILSVIAAVDLALMLNGG